MKRRWVSWSMGRKWAMWHLPYFASETRPLRSKCWRMVSPNARVCFSLNPPREQCCLKCLEIQGSHVNLKVSR